MRILSIGQRLQHAALPITSIEASELAGHEDIPLYDYIIISGGDGTIRRVINTLQHIPHSAAFILNPTGSFNVVAKLHRVPKVEKVLKRLAEGETLRTQKHRYYTLNQEVFLFSAGNMGDLQHIFLAETLRFGLLKGNMLKYLLAVLFLLPLHLVMTPFMLLSANRFFIFTPASFIKKFGSFYGEVKELRIDLGNSYNFVELDGDIVTIEEPLLHIKPAGDIDIVIAY
ncbi:MAG TPA: diacylglycerol kinase family protein [Sulfurovum sp.]|uniref:diacylglycerol kinase family protein n=1 Tax=Sulfurovum sp. TaxID=1969726 RepID=UPI002F93A6B7